MTEFFLGPFSDFNFLELTPTCGRTPGTPTSSDGIPQFDMLGERIVPTQTETVSNVQIIPTANGASENNHFNPPSSDAVPNLVGNLIGTESELTPSPPTQPNIITTTNPLPPPNTNETISGVNIVGTINTPDVAPSNGPSVGMLIDI